MDSSQWILGLGLGRGIDATDVEPWQHLSSFQVREVTPDNVVFTDGIAKMEHFEEDIKSAVDQHAEIAASAQKSGIASIGIFAEKSRSLKQSKKMVGSRVLTRTITFRSDFTNLPVDSIQTIAGSTDVYIDNHKTEINPERVCDFEEKLCAWILQRIDARQFHTTERAKHNSTGGEPSPNSKPVHALSSKSSISQLAGYINSLENKCSELESIVRDCDHFVRKGAGGTRAITHYVYQLKLGAFEYEILTQEEYNSKYRLGGKISAEHPTIAGGELSGEYSHTNTHELSSAGGKSVGKITDGIVNKGTDDERVIGVEIKPVHTLINHLPYLRQAMKEAESRYILEKQNLTEGPFLIWCSLQEKRIYWRVHDNGFVLGTQQRREASAFYLMPSTNEQHPCEFFIAHFDPQRGGHNDGYQQSKYLKAHINLFGNNSGPLKVKDYVKHYDARLTLQSRNPDEDKADHPVDIRSWGKESLFLKCARRKRRLDGYISMTKQSQSKLCHRETSTSEFQYITTCVRSRSNHEDPHTSLLFNVEHLEEEERDENEHQRPKIVHDMQICRENWIQNGIKSINTDLGGTVRKGGKSTSKQTRKAEPHGAEYLRSNSGQRPKLYGHKLKYLPQVALTSEEHLLDMVQANTQSSEASHSLPIWDEYTYTENSLAPNFLRNVVTEPDTAINSHARPQLASDSLLVPPNDVRKKANAAFCVNVEMHNQETR